MMLKIRPRSMLTDILLTAVSPPKRFVTSREVRMYLSSATLGPFLFEVLAFRVASQFALPARGRKEPSGTVDHHDDQDDSEDKALVLGGIQLVGEVLPVEPDDRDHRFALPQLGQV